MTLTELRSHLSHLLASGDTPVMLYTQEFATYRVLADVRLSAVTPSAMGLGDDNWEETQQTDTPVVAVLLDQG